MISTWTVNDEKIAVAREIELGTREAVHSHLENFLPDSLGIKTIHIEELAKMAERLREL